ncbi:MAG: hypothetical protein FWJ90_07490 [Actinomadura sp.]
MRLSGDGQTLPGRLPASIPVPARAALLWGLPEFRAASRPETGGSVPLPA